MVASLCRSMADARPGGVKKVELDDGRDVGGRVTGDGRVLTGVMGVWREGG